MRKLIYLILILIANPAVSQSLDKTYLIRNYIDNFKYQSAINLIDTQQKSDNDDELYIYKGRALKGLTKYSEAIMAFNTAYKIDSGNLSALIELSDLYFMLENYMKAKDLYLDLANRDSANAIFTRNIARCYDNIDKTDSAIVYFEKTIRQNAYDAQSVNRLGNIYVKNKNFKRGIEITDAYRSIDTANVRINRLNSYLYLMNKEYDTAKNKFTKCIENHDTTDFVYKNLGICLFRLDDFDTARIYLEKAYFKDTTDAQTCYFLGMACTNSYYKSLGITYLNKAVALLNPSPKYMSGVYQNLAEACNGYFKYKEGLDALLKAYELTPCDTMLIYKLGSQYDYYIKNKDSAVRYYKEFMLTRPKDKKEPVMENRGPLVISYYDAVEHRLIEIEEENGKKRQ
jgi:tetratricopeptide (TPR) repeat protein